MSRIGRKPIDVPSTVTVTIEPEVVRVSGPRGNLEERKNRDIEVSQENGTLTVTRKQATLGYTGSLFWSTGSATATTASVTLQAQVTALQPGQPVDLSEINAQLATRPYSYPIPYPVPRPYPVYPRPWPYPYWRTGLSNTAASYTPAMSAKQPLAIAQSSSC